MRDVRFLLVTHPTVPMVTLSDIAVAPVPEAGSCYCGAQLVVDSYKRSGSESC